MNWLELSLLINAANKNICNSSLQCWYTEAPATCGKQTENWILPRTHVQRAWVSAVTRSDGWMLPKIPGKKSSDTHITSYYSLVLQGADAFDYRDHEFLMTAFMNKFNHNLMSAHMWDVGINTIPVLLCDSFCLGPTDLSMKRQLATGSGSSSSSNSRPQLSPTEINAVRQLVAGYRESAAFLLRSADELENLILQQNWSKRCPYPLSSKFAVSTNDTWFPSRDAPGLAAQSLKRNTSILPRSPWSIHWCVKKLQRNSDLEALEMLKCAQPVAFCFSVST